MDICLHETTLNQIAEAVREVDTSSAFLHSRDEPDFSCYSFLSGFEGDPGFHLFAVRDEDTTAGFISLLPGAGRERLDIGPTYIRPAYQNRGLGSQQIQAVVQWAKERGVRHMGARTWGENIRARQVFEKAGFVLEREALNARVNGDSTVYYRLDLETGS
jgi:RimJ/RimL family protein N-acetyltransferase